MRHHTDRVRGRRGRENEFGEASGFAKAMKEAFVLNSSQRTLDKAREQFALDNILITGGIMPRILLTGCSLCVFLFLSVVNAQIPTNGLVAWYPLNGNANDSSGNGNNGTVSGAIPTTDRFGKSGQALSFNGSNAKVTLPDLYIGDTTQDKSFSAWFRLDQTYAYLSLLSQSTGPTSGSSNYWIIEVNNKEVIVGQYINAKDNSPFKISVNLDTTRYHHLAVICSNSYPTNQKIKVFLDGLLVGSISSTNILGLAGNTYIEWATEWGGSTFHPGSLDDIRIYNRVLNATEINSLYHESGYDSSLVAYYPFNGNANDESGNGNNGIVYGAIPTADRFGNAGKAYSFDGSDAYIGAPNSPSLNPENGITLSAWVYLETYYSTDWMVSVINKWQSYILQMSPTYGLTLTLPTPPTWDGIWRAIPDSDDISLNQWCHLCATFDKPTGYAVIYLNGEKLSTVPRSDFSAPTTIHADTDGIKIGCEYSSYDGYWQFWHGKLDDIRIYSRALSVAEIGSLYHEGGWPITGVESQRSGVPTKYDLEQNYPNPFNPSTTIQYSLPYRSSVRLEVFDVLGRRVALLYDGEQGAGYQRLQWNAGVSTGIYLYRIHASSVENPNNQFNRVKKMLLLK